MMIIKEIIFWTVIIYGITLVLRKNLAILRGNYHKVCFIHKRIQKTKFNENKTQRK